MLLAAAAVAALLADVHTGHLRQNQPSNQNLEVSAPPGSAIKPFVLEALLDAHVLPAKPDYICPGKLTLAGRNFACHHPITNRPMDAETALAYSCNNFFIHYAARLPVGALSRTLLKFGIAAPDAPLLPLGESGLRLTAPQMLEAYRKLALRHHPEVGAGMLAAVRYGTGQMAAVSNVRVAGKTGTASGGYAWFAGFAPADKPEVAFAVLARHDAGGLAAAPIARQMLLRWQGRENEVAVMTRSGLRTLPLEDYVAGVVEGEAAELHRKEALKAQAVAARTFAAAFRGRHESEGFDFCSNTHCQRYLDTPPQQTVRIATEETAGELLWRNGSPVETFYGQDCGGVKDPYCRPRQQWTTTLRPSEILQALQAEKLQIPKTLAPRILDKDQEGRVITLDLGDGAPLSASSFRFAVGRNLGWNRIRSDLYQIQGLTFTGYGTGNGQGLCQHGADKMPGDYRKILAFYYPGTVLGVNARGISWHPVSGERVELWSTAPEKDSALVATADRLIPEIERLTGLRMEVIPRITVYPTLTIYRDATGEPGWVAASTRGRVIRMQPAAATREVMHHELLHVILESHAKPGLPVWFREGLALSLTGGAQPDDPAYREYRKRVEACERTYGRAAVIGWLASGLPLEVKNITASQPVTVRQ